MSKVHLKIRTRAPVHLRIRRGGDSPAAWYEGPYEVTPTRSEQTLGTRDKTMREDVTVHEIPYYETANPYGKTYIIGE